eukprot:COSAG02_NODE_1273_length_13520_cov_2.622010_1_plen_2144_part_00
MCTCSAFGGYPWGRGGMERVLTAWSAQDVGAWLRDAVGLPQYAEVFAANDISGALLLALTEDEMASELGVTSGIHRKRILLRAHKEAGSEWQAASSTFEGARATSSASALWSTNSSSSLSPRVRAALSSASSHQPEPGGAPGTPGNSGLRVHTLSRSRDEGILPDQFAQLGQRGGDPGAATAGSTAAPSAAVGDGDSAAARETGGGRKSSTSGYELVDDGMVRIMSLAEQQAALEQARAQGAALERKRFEEQSQKLAAEKAASEEESAGRKARQELLKQKEEDERQRERAAQEKRTAAEELAKREAERRRSHADALERDRHARLGLADPPVSPAPRRSLSRTLSANMRESITWKTREATRETILGSDAAIEETHKLPATSSLPASLAVRPSTRVNRSPWKKTSVAVHTATGVVGSLGRTGSRSYPWRSESATSVGDAIDPNIWDAAPRNVGSVASSASSEEEDLDNGSSDRDGRESIPSTPALSPGGVLARRKARLQQQRKAREENVTNPAVSAMACDDVATGLQHSHEIWENGREAIEIAEVAREHRLDIPTARVVHRRLEQERRQKISGELRALSTTRNVMAGPNVAATSATLQLSTVSFANPPATGATVAGADAHSHGHVDLLNELRKQTKDDTNKFVLRTFQLDKTAGTCGQVQFWKAKAPDKVFYVECAEISLVQKGFDGPALERHYLDCEFQFAYESGKVMRLRAETSTVCDQWVSALRDIEIELMHKKRGSDKLSTRSWSQADYVGSPEISWRRDAPADSLAGTQSNDQATLDQTFARYSNHSNCLMNKSDLKLLLVSEFGFQNDDALDGMADTLLIELGQFDTGAEGHIDRTGFDALRQRFSTSHHQELEPTRSIVTTPDSAASPQSPVSISSDFESDSSPIGGFATGGGDKSALEAQLEKLKQQKDERRKARKSKQFRKSLKHKYRTAPFKIPPGWESAETSAGKTYYFNRETGEKSWDPPTLANVAEEGLNKSYSHDASDPASGWFVVYTIDGRQITVHWEGQPSLRNLEEQLKSELHIYSSFRLVTAGGDGVNLSVDTPAGSQFLLQLDGSGIASGPSQSRHEPKSISISNADLDALGAEIDLAQGQAKAAASLDQQIEASKRLMYATESLREHQGCIDTTVAAEFGHRLGMADIAHHKLNEDILFQIHGMLGRAHKRYQTSNGDQQSLVDAYEEVLVYYLAVSESGLVPQEYMPGVHSKMQEAIGRIDLLRSEAGLPLAPIAANETQESQQLTPVSGVKQTKVRPPLPPAPLPTRRPPLPTVADGETPSGRSASFQHSGTKPDVHRAQFDKYDRDRTGTLDVHEMVSLLHELNFDTSIDFAKKIMAQFDADRSGGISFEEFKQMWAILEPQESDPAVAGAGTSSPEAPDRAVSTGVHDRPVGTAGAETTVQPNGAKPPATPLENSRSPIAPDPNNPTAGMSTLQKKAYAKLQAKKKEVCSPPTTGTGGRTKRSPSSFAGEMASLDALSTGDPRNNNGVSLSQTPPAQGAAKPPSSTDIPLAMWNQFDKDKSGQLEAHELGALLNHCGFDAAIASMLMASFDADQNGAIGYDEFLHLWAEIKPQSAAAGLASAGTPSTGRKKRPPLPGAELEQKPGPQMRPEPEPETEPTRTVKQGPDPEPEPEPELSPADLAPGARLTISLGRRKKGPLGWKIEMHEEHGNLVRSVTPNTPAAAANVPVPSHVVEINSKPVRTPDDIQDTLILVGKKEVEVTFLGAGPSLVANIQTKTGEDQPPPPLQVPAADRPATSDMMQGATEPPEGMTKLQSLKWKKAQRVLQQVKEAKAEERASAKAAVVGPSAQRDGSDNGVSQGARPAAEPAAAPASSEPPEGLSKIEQLKWKKKQREAQPANSVISTRAGTGSDAGASDSKPLDPDTKAVRKKKKKPRPPLPEEDDQQASGAATTRTTGQDSKQVTLADMPPGLTKLEEIKWKKANGLNAKKPTTTRATKGDGVGGGSTGAASDTPKAANTEKPKASATAEAPAPAPESTPGGVTLDDMPDGLTKLEQMKWKKANGLAKGGTASKTAKPRASMKPATAVEPTPAPAPSAAGGLTLADMPGGMTTMEQLKWKKANGLAPSHKKARPKKPDGAATTSKRNAGGASGAPIGAEPPAGLSKIEQLKWKKQQKLEQQQ